MMIGWRMSSSYLVSRYGRVSASVSNLRSRSGLDPDSIRSVDPYPDSESGSGSRRAKMTVKFFYIYFMFLSARCSLLSAEL